MVDFVNDLIKLSNIFSAEIIERAFDDPRLPESWWC
jgi:hypothetical protein